MNNLLPARLQHFYRTSALACPYLSGKIERKVITELGGRDASPLYNELSRAGFRRSHQLAYRPACAGCSACVPVRVDARRFRHGRSARRLQGLNADLRATVVVAEAVREHYHLFMRYQRSRHAQSDMAAMSFGDYRSMIEDSPVETFLSVFRDGGGAPIGVCLTDRLDDGLSAVYSFFDPDQGKRSLGTYMVLWLIEEAQRLGLDYVYLGYWVAESRKMAYKTRFRPIEGLGPEGWRPLSLKP
jgi:arginyl-tRNA--protein-N-Asp/Glu arginylyltransferase